MRNRFVCAAVAALFVAVVGAQSTSDPRVGLKAGLHDAGEAIRGLERVASLSNPAGFFDPKQPGGAYGSGGGAFGGGSAGVGAPAGCFGSKNPVGFDRLATRSSPRMASPASCSPALSPTRGSLVDCAATTTARQAADNALHTIRFIRILMGTLKGCPYTNSRSGTLSGCRDTSS